MGIKLFLLLLLSFVVVELHAGLIYTHAIYGQDDREFITKRSKPKFIELGSSVALIISNDLMEKKWLNYQIQAESLQASVGLCSDEKHSQLPSISNCTGFLVGEDLLLSAGHCFMDESDCINKKIIFDVTREKVNSRGYKVAKNKVFSCKEILVSSVDPQLDFSLVRLDRKVVKRSILRLRPMELNKQESNYAYLIGHPLGLPLMKTSAEVLMMIDSETTIKAALDSFLGNSGSPVIHSESQNLIGLLVNGNEDFEWDEVNKCQRYKKYDSLGNEGILSIQKILPLVKSYL